ncbi:hypothetical protein M0R45_028972 [Rubus argutus]|uniref:Uncharacterized protein n=1 Tax=Rubus argutus TaxID=59490 RepID=A0AAW1WAW8_RUBAR
MHLNSLLATKASMTASSDSEASMARSDSDNRSSPHQESSASAGSANIDLSKTTAVHAAYSFIILLLVSLVGLKFLSSGTNPFNTQPWIMFLFITTAFAYFSALLAEITFDGALTTSNLFRYLYLISGAVACELLGFVLVGPFGLLPMNACVFILIVLLRHINQLKQITTTPTQQITQDVESGEIQLTSQSSD